MRGEVEPSAMGEALHDAIHAANSGQADPEGVAPTLTNETMKLFDAGLLHDLDTPSTWEGEFQKDYYFPKLVPLFARRMQPISICSK